MLPRLFKYREYKLDTATLVDRTESIFLNNELYFSTPAQFNDPFDCQVHLDFSRISKDEFWRYYDNVISKKTKLTPDQRRVTFEAAYSSGETKNMFIKSIQDSFNSRGVYSLSSKYNDNLMWSHYSDGHRGYCFELDKLKLKPIRVKYRKRYPMFNLFQNDSLLRILLFTKSTHWKYEREWRYFSQSKGPINIDDGTIKSVILGSQMNQKNRVSLLSIISRSKHTPKIYEAIIDKKTYTISVKEYGTQL